MPQTGSLPAAATGALAALTALLAELASANPRYDGKTPAGGLQRVCKGFLIDSSGDATVVDATAGKLECKSAT